MRTIKFRAWHKREGRFLHEHDRPWCISPKGKFCWWQDNGGWQESEDCELDQSTGLIDIHGKEIYENDVLLAYGYSAQKRDPHKSHWRVQWDANYGGSYVKRNSGLAQLYLTANVDRDDEEVIGNVRENPELIEGWEKAW